MKRILIFMFIICFASLPTNAKNIVIKTGYSILRVDDLARTLVHTDLITQNSKTYLITESQTLEDGTWQFVATNSGNYYLFELYKVEDKTFIGEYEYKISPHSNHSVRLFETARGKINFDSFNDYFLKNIEDYISQAKLSGESAQAYREESAKYLNGIKSGNVTRLNADNSFSINNETGFKDFRGYIPKIKKGSAWKGTNDEYIKDADYGRNTAIRDLATRISRWDIYNESQDKQWVFIIKSQVKSVTVE